MKLPPQPKGIGYICVTFSLCCLPLVQRMHMAPWDNWVPFYLQGLSQSMIWICNHTHCLSWYVVTQWLDAPLSYTNVVRTNVLWINDNVTLNYNDCLQDHPCPNFNDVLAGWLLKLAHKCVITSHYFGLMWLIFPWTNSLVVYVNSLRNGNHRRSYCCPVAPFTNMV